MNRRKFFKTLGITAGAITLAPNLFSGEKQGYRMKGIKDYIQCNRSSYEIHWSPLMTIDDWDKLLVDQLKEDIEKQIFFGIK